MKKMFVVSLVLAAALAVGCSKKQAPTTPGGTETKTEMKPDESKMGGDSYGGAKTEGGTEGGAGPEAPKN